MIISRFSGNAAMAVLRGIAVNSVTIQAFDSAGVSADRGGSFIAIGPRNTSGDLP